MKWIIYDLKILPWSVTFKIKHKYGIDRIKVKRQRKKANDSERDQCFIMHEI